MAKTTPKRKAVTWASTKAITEAIKDGLYKESLKADIVTKVKDGKLIMINKVTGETQTLGAAITYPVDKHIITLKTK